jgi:hypothetical protein
MQFGTLSTAVLDAGACSGLPGGQTMSAALPADPAIWSLLPGPHHCHTLTPSACALATRLAKMASVAAHH